MKTDPNEGCNLKEEHLFWAVVHDAICHPLMALSGYSKWAIKLHNYTSHRAWPRETKSAAHKLASKGETLGVQ